MVWRPIVLIHTPAITVAAFLKTVILLRSHGMEPVEFFLFFGYLLTRSSPLVSLALVLSLISQKWKRIKRRFLNGDNELTRPL